MRCPGEAGMFDVCAQCSFLRAVSQAAFLHNLGEDSGGGEEDELLEVRVPALCHSQLKGIEINLPPGATLMIFRRRNRW